MLLTQLYPFEHLTLWQDFQVKVDLHCSIAGEFKGAWSAVE